MDLELKGMSVLITGASKGIGLAAARAFAAEGCNLHLAARSGEALASARDELVRDHGVAVEVHVADLSRTENVVELGRRCASVDILVNNAGEIPSGPIESLTEDDWRRGYDLKLFGYIGLTRELYAAVNKVFAEAWKAGRADGDGRLSPDEPARGAREGLARREGAAATKVPPAGPSRHDNSNCSMEDLFR